MIGKLHGVLEEKTPPLISVRVGGITYELDVSMNTIYNLPEAGSEIKLFTHFLVREDAHLLFGFHSEQERKMFRLLLKINGVGARTALAVLGGMTTEELSAVVAEGNTDRLIKVPGIGKKTADRMLLELKDRIGQFQETPSSQLGSTMKNDVLGALVSLGYGEKEILRVLARTNLEQPLSAAIKQALQFLSGVKKD
tara:strand:+ start:95 stop:682 length:588 start_codon:yes stop_codon:yes gene_type:complete